MKTLMTKSPYVPQQPEYATKSDVTEVIRESEDRVQQKLDDLRGELKEEIGLVRTEVQGLKFQAEGLKVHVDGQFRIVREDMDDMKRELLTAIRQKA